MTHGADGDPDGPTLTAQCTEKWANKCFKSLSMGWFVIIQKLIDSVINL